MGLTKGAFQGELFFKKIDNLKWKIKKNMVWNFVFTQRFFFHFERSERASSGVTFSKSKFWTSFSSAVFRPCIISF